MHGLLVSPLEMGTPLGLHILGHTRRENHKKYPHFELPGRKHHIKCTQLRVPRLGTNRMQLGMRGRESHDGRHFGTLV